MTEAMNPPPTPSKSRNGRLWPLSLATLGIVLALHIGSTMLWRDRLPEPVATHWNGAGVADGTGALALHLLMGAFTMVLVGILLPVSVRGVPASGNRSGVPLMAGLGNGIVVGLGALFISGLSGQLDAPQALGARMDGPVLVGGLFLAVVWALASAFLVRSALPSREAPPAPAPTAPAGTDVFAPGTVVASFVRGPVWMLVLFAVLALGMVALGSIAGKDSPAVTWSMVPAVVIMLGAGSTCLAGRIVADDSGIRVLGGGFLKMLHVRPGDIAVVEAREITPAEFGGWGLRISGSGVAFIVGAGPGVVVNRPRGAARIYSVATMEDAAAIAGLLNQQAADRGAGSST